MPAIVIFYSTPIDTAKLAEYSAGALATVVAHGGAPVTLGPAASLHNGADFERGAVFSFPDRETAQRWYRSPEYSALSGLRAAAMRFSISLIG